MHPAWRGGAGTIFARYKYRCRIPSRSVSFSNAIRDIGPPEPSSDGVTFRVWVGEKAIFEKYTDSKSWLGGKVDLSPFAGQEIVLRLESHPGPKKDTTCDSAFWGEPVIASGQQAAEAASKSQSPKAFRFGLEDGIL